MNVSTIFYGSDFSYKVSYFSDETIYINHFIVLVYYSNRQILFMIQFMEEKQESIKTNV